MVSSWAKIPVVQKCPRCSASDVFDTGYHYELDIGEEQRMFIQHLCPKCGLLFFVWEDRL